MTSKKIKWTLISAFYLTFTPAQSELPRVFVSAPDFKPVNYSIACNACANRNPFLSLILVISHTGNFAKRQAMRKSYSKEEIAALGFRRVFVIGTKEGEENNERYPSKSAVSATEESQTFGDLLQLGMADTYDGLLVKVHAAFSWAVENCEHARYVTKVDDDMVIDYYSFAKVLDEGDDLDAIRGRYFDNPEYITPYISGGCYVSTPKTFKRLLQASETTQPFMHYAEDAYFTGVLADKVSVHRVDVASIRHWEGAPHCCVDDVSGVVYACQHAVFEDRSGMTSAHLRRFKAHGMFCYFFRCESLTGAVISKERITCFR